MIAADIADRADDTALSPTQRRVLEAVKRHGEATANELATTLEISPSAVRQHLSALRSAGLVATRRERGQPGRPADRYQATELAESLFVAPEDNLSIELLTLIDEEEPDLVQRMFDRRRQRLVDDARHDLDGTPMPDRIAQLTALLDSRGYLCDWEQTDADQYRISLHNCAIWTVASRFRQACTSELQFLRDVLPDATVTRITHKTNGAHSCAYQVTARGVPVQRSVDVAGPANESTNAPISEHDAATA